MPYSMLRDVYGITGRGRLVYHPINDIGNLTYISAALNDYETGLGADPVRLEYVPRANVDDDLIRELKYPAELEDVLLARLDDPKFRLKVKGHKESKEQSLLVSRRGNSKGVVLELKRCRNAVEIMSKDPTMIACMSRLASAGSLKMISETQWHLRVDLARPAEAASVLSTLLDQILGAKS